MFDSNVSPLLVIALEMILAGMGIALLHHLFRLQRIMIRQFPARLGPVHQGTFILIYFTTPTTFLINPRGQLSHVNHGVARAEKLLIQMHGIEIEN